MSLLDLSISLRVFEKSLIFLLEGTSIAAHSAFKKRIVRQPAITSFILQRVLGDMIYAKVSITNMRTKIWN